MLRSRGDNFLYVQIGNNKAQPGGHLSLEKKAIEQNFSDICHLKIDHPGMGS